MKKIDGSAGGQVIAALEPVAPDFAQLLIEFGFGDIYSRPQLDLCAREIVGVFMQNAMYAGFLGSSNATNCQLSITTSTLSGR